MTLSFPVSAPDLPRLDGPVPLICPRCRGALAYTPTPVESFDGEFGVLSCGCDEYPVLDGIPVLRRGRVDVQEHATGRTEVDGPTVGRLVELLRDGRGVDALVAMLAFPPRLPRRFPARRGPAARLALAARRAEVRAMLDDVDALTAQDWMELAYLRSSDRIDQEMFGYFFVRYGQPRYLASISLLRALPASDAPVLDLACGFGHTMYHLGARKRPLPTVGVDRNFFQLWVGRRYIAPGQTFVCADRVDALPFPDDVFAASTCTDAFHYFDDQQGAMDELRRVARADTVLVDRVGNRAVEPRDAAGEQDAAGYVALLRGAPWRLTSEDEVVGDYHDGHGPRLAARRHPGELRRSKWLALFSSRDQSLFVDHGTFAAPPHAAGALGVNPVYAVRRDGDDVVLAFSFPSTWYAFENAAMLGYTSPGERLDGEDFEALVAGRGHASFVDRFVLLGLPPRYARRPGSALRSSVLPGLLAGARYALRRR
ncbi:methyltransferase family protein [Actinomycetospora succinea]|uniref:Methyltransferase family protein n=1 Tax=Actinomycetospora succinea TaxID=663603 RepID=A0A4R6VQJ7_9PSEU|nr:class I SAM-dependent methyltransferase [Actinomycetospora succinea]TDQ64806.1 methyltransferase family protein [Actinomycetospora succinea]